MSALEDQFERSLSESLKRFQSALDHRKDAQESKREIDEAIDKYRQKREDKVELLERSMYSLVRVTAVQNVHKVATVI